MIKKLFLVALPFLLQTDLIAQGGRVLEDQSLTSEILRDDRMYAVYLPPDYETSTRRYPVLYLLHGRSDEHWAWIQFGEVKRVADTAIANGSATPMIIIMPNATSGTENYLNRIDRDWRYEDFFFEELIPHVEATYRTRATKQYRAIAGLSMGGGGTFLYALHRPDVFSSAAPLSASFTLDPDSFRRYFRIDESISGDEFDGHWKANSVLHLIESMPDDQRRAVRWYIDCGDDDFLYEQNSLVHIAMRKRDIPHEYRVRDGGHTWSYWREALPDVLTFISEAFHR